MYTLYKFNPLITVKYAFRSAMMFRKIPKNSKFLDISLSNYLSLRRVHHQPKEVTIKVPWGHISGLHWNESPSATPFLCLHGWKDNAASFNKLIPKMLDISQKSQFLAIDLPGHGFSSHYPPGMMYQLVDNLIAIRRVVNHFRWTDARGIHLMGHSLGAILSFLFAASHPKLVDCMIAIDALLPMFAQADDIISLINVITDGVLSLESHQSSNSKTYTYEQLRDRFLASHMGTSEVICDVLLPRGAAQFPPNSGQWRFTHDPRVHYLPLMAIDSEQIESFAKSFKSKLLLITAEYGVNYLSDYTAANMKQWLAKNNKQDIRYLEVEQAIHHLHIMEPEKITPAIMQFLEETHNK